MVIRDVGDEDIICKECHGESLMGVKVFTHIVYEHGLWNLEVRRSSTVVSHVYAMVVNNDT